MSFDRAAHQAEMMRRLAAAMDAPLSPEVEDTLLASEMVGLEAEHVVAEFPAEEQEAARRGLYRDTDGVLRTSYQSR